MRSKKAQITIFIIIGLIILFSAAIIIYLRQEKVEEIPKIEVPQEIQPVETYVRVCIEDLAEEAILRVGETGGYMSFDEFPRIKDDPTASLRIAPFGNLKLPYWWYNGRDNMPPKDFILRQIRDYINTQLPLCTADFTSFKEFDISEGIVSTEVIAEEYMQDTVFKVNYPLIIKDKTTNKEYKLENVYVKSPYRLGKVYELAREIMEIENEKTFLERITMSLLALDNEHIPTSGWELSLKQKMWKIPKIEERIKELLVANLQYIKVFGTDYIPIPDYLPYMQNHYVWNFTTEDYSGIGVGFTYDPNWPFYMAVRPSQGLYLKSSTQKVQQYLKWLGIQMWHFTYDIVYPVRVSVVDKETDLHKAYMFNFAFQVSINHNQGDRTNFATTLFPIEMTPTSEEMCEETLTEKEINIEAIDEFSREPLGNVNITYTCGNINCYIGVIEWDDGPFPLLNKKFPYCVWGVLRGQKEGYETGEMFMSAYASGFSPQEMQTIKLRPIKTFINYTVVKHFQSKPHIEKYLSEEEQATIVILNPITQKEFYADYPGQTQSIDIYDGKSVDYNVTIYLVNKDTFLGGYEGTWHVTPDDVKTGESIKFHVITTDTTDEDELYLFITGLKSYSKEIPEPEFVK